MKTELLEFLRCPLCAEKMRAESFEAEGGDVASGLLHCDCGGSWPIINGIPRIIDDPFREHPEFARTFATRLPEGLTPSRAHDRTRESFGLQWTTYDVLRPEEDEATFGAKTGFRPEQLEGKVVLDAGCGSGRYSAVAARWGAKVISFDLGRAVERARENVKDCGDVHLMQADVFKLPLPPAAFDYIFSIGVLHHTPNTRKAFLRLLPLLKRGGRIAVWLYKKRDALYEAVNMILRGITFRLDHATLARWARIAVPVGAFKRWAFKRRWTAVLSKLIPTVSTHPDAPIRVCDTFDWYSPEFQFHHTDEEVEAWFRGGGLVDIVNLSTDQALYHEGQGEGVNFAGTRDERLNNMFAKRLTP